MAGLIKNQILKHLSKFTKNLSPDKIHVSTLKGEGDLSNLELDERVLTELLDLPTWLKISKAVCNRVAIKIQWTKLKSQPICLYLDEIEVDMETCDNIREPTVGSPLSDFSQGGKYGLAEKIVDGMYVSINSVIVNFKATQFAASIQMSRIIIQSKTPIWALASDLRLTRIKDELRGHILLFKEAEWQTLRIEANALAGSGPDGQEQLTSTPLRLIANQSKVRITIKKRLIDCGIIASRLLVSLDDLLWVLTDSQLKAALSFVNSLKQVIKDSSLQSKHLAAEKVKKQGFQANPSHNNIHNKGKHQAQNQKVGSKSQQAIAKLFDKYNIQETSYHLHTTRVDLHLCDDSIPEDEQHRRKVEGGALQLTLYKLCFDFYPFHPAGGEREHWMRFDENMATRHEWAKQLLEAFRDDVSRVRNILSNSTLNSPTNEKSPKSMTTSFIAKDIHDKTPSTNKTQHGGNVPKSQSHNFASESARSSSHTPSFHAAKHTKLLENSMILRLEDLVIYQVSSSTSNSHAVPQKLLCSDKKALCLPPEMSSIHVEYTDYYFPDGIDFPVPSSNMYIVVNPMKLQFDYNTLLWLNAFLLNLQRTLDLPEPEGPVFHTDIRIEALMPRIILPIENEQPDQVDRPSGLQLQMSRVAISNSRQGVKTSIDDLKEAVLVHDSAKLFHMEEIGFPRSANELQAYPDCVLEHLLGKDSPYFDKTIEEILVTAQIPASLSSYNLAEVVDDTRDEWEIVTKDDDMSKKFMKKSDTIDSVSSLGLTYYNMRTDSLKKLATKDVWCLAIDQFWVEFVGASSARNRPQPFMESFPVTLWVFRPKIGNNLSEAVSTDTLMSNAQAGSIYDQPQSIQSRHCSDMIDGCQSNAMHESYISSNSCQRKSSDNVPNSIRDSKSSSNLNQDSCDNMCKTSHNVINSAAALGDNRGGIGDNTDCTSQKGHPNKCASDIHILVKVGGKVNLQLSHYQFLFIMRLVEKMTDMLNEIKDDKRFITQKPLPQQSLSLSVIVKEAELALICPPIADLPSPETSIDDSSDLTLDDTMTDHDNVLYEDSPIDTSNIIEPRLVITSSHKSHSDTELASPLGSGSDDNQSGKTLTKATHSCSDFSTNEVQASIDQSLLAQGDKMLHTGSTSNSSTPLSARRKISSQSNFSEGYASMGSSPKRDGKRPVDIKKSLNVGLSNISKGFGVFGSKISDKMKQNMRRDGDFDDELWETQSCRSTSSDDEDYLLLKFENRDELPAFEKHYQDTTSEDEAVSLLNVATGEGKQKGVVSIATFKLKNVQSFIQLDGDDTIVSSTVDHVIPEELGNVLLDKFQERFATDIIEQEGETPKVETAPIKLRFQQGPKAEKYTAAAKDRGYLHLRVNKFRSTFGIASLTGLTDLIEDEKHGPVMPMLIDVCDSFITLQDNRPPTNMTSPGKVPMDMRISKVVVKRTEDGVFHILGDTLPEDMFPDDKYVRQRSVQTTPSIDNPPTAHPIRIDSTITDRPLAMSYQPDLLGAIETRHIAGGDAGFLEERVRTLQGENEELRRQLERIGKMSSQTGGIDHDSLQSLQNECDHLRSKCKKLDQLKTEHRATLQELSNQADDNSALKLERKSLVATIQLLQEELMDSENMRLQEGSNHANS